MAKKAAHLESIWPLTGRPRRPVRTASTGRGCRGCTITAVLGTVPAVLGTLGAVLGTLDAVLGTRDSFDGDWISNLARARAAGRRPATSGVGPAAPLTARACMLASTLALMTEFIRAPWGHRLGGPRSSPGDLTHGAVGGALARHWRGWRGRRLVRPPTKPRWRRRPSAATRWRWPAPLGRHLPKDSLALLLEPAQAVVVALERWLLVAHPRERRLALRHLLLHLRALELLPLHRLPRISLEVLGRRTLLLLLCGRRPPLLCLWLRPLLLLLLRPDSTSDRLLLLLLADDVLLGEDAGHHGRLHLPSADVGLASGRPRAKLLAAVAVIRAVGRHVRARRSCCSRRAFGVR